MADLKQYTIHITGSGTAYEIAKSLKKTIETITKMPNLVGHDTIYLPDKHLDIEITEQNP